MEIKINVHGNPLPVMIKGGDWIDLQSAETVTLQAGDYQEISLGISMQLPPGYEAHLAPRSSTFKRWGILLVNGVAVIDNSFCGNEDIWKFPAFAMRDTTIMRGDRICQFRIMQRQPFFEFKQVAQLMGKNRGGFGSTGSR